jgi:hypothetical protein
MGAPLANDFVALRERNQVREAPKRNRVPVIPQVSYRDISGVGFRHRLGIVVKLLFRVNANRPRVR